MESHNFYQEVECVSGPVPVPVDTSSASSRCPFHDLGLCNDLDVFEPKLISASSFRTVRKGSCLGLQDSGSYGLIVILRGIIKLSRSLSDGRTQIIGIRYPGDILTSLDSERPWSFSVEAVTEASLCTVDRKALRRAREQYADLDLRLAECMHDEVARSQDHIMTLGRKTPIERLASFLVELDRHQACDGGRSDKLTIPLLRADIADYLGLESETVSRLFTKLKAAGIIELASPSRVALSDRRSLQDLADGRGEICAGR